VSARSWRKRSAAFALPVLLASGCLLVAPPEDLPASGTGGSGAHGGGGSAGSTVVEAGGSGASMMAGGDAGGESNPEGGSPGSGGSGGAAGSGETGASGGRGGAGGSAGGGAKGGTGAKGGAGGTEPTGGAGEGGAPGCTTNKECGDYWGGPARCRGDGTCVQLGSNECLLVEGNSNDPNALFVGSFVPYGDNPKKGDVFAAEKLAVDELNDAGGLPGGNGGSGRPLVLVACSNDSSDAISLGLTHLAEEVQVPGLIAMLQGADLTHALQQEKDRKLFYLNPVASLQSLTSDAKTTKGLLWTLLGVPSDYAPAYQLLLSDLEKQVHSERGLMPSDPIKVVLINTTDAFNDELRLYVFQSLFFNNAAAANNGSNYKEYTFDPTSFPSDDQLNEMLAFEPDIVISTAGDVMTASAGVLPRLETGWTSTKPRPFYLLSPYNGTSDAQGVIQSIVTSEVDDTSNPEPNAARRFLGVNAAPALDPSLENGFVTRYNFAFPDLKGTAPNVDNYYDAVYYLAYSMYAGDSLTGPGIANGMKRLITGDPFDDGNANMAIPKAFTALEASGATISLNSTLGPPDFVATTGVRPVTPGVFCFTYNGSLVLRPNALRYDPTMNEFTGTYPCLDNFPPP